MSTTLRADEETRDRFARLSRETGRPMSRLLSEAADALERRLFFEGLGNRYAELRADPAAWAEITTEREIESQALGDTST
jgi:hypothetical protein